MELKLEHKKPTSFTIIAGLSYSDEGKGKISKRLMDDYDVVMRVASSWNASHTAFIDGKEHTSFHLPTCFSPNKQQVVGPGVYLFLPMLLRELKERQGEEIAIHERSQVILERNKDHVQKAFGTIGSGIRDAVIRRINHQGKTIREQIKGADLTEEDLKLVESHLVDHQGYLDILSNKRILVEGTNGYEIDNVFGKYPYTTAVNTIPSYFMAMTGFDPSYHEKTIFVGGLINFSLGIHPEFVSFEDVGLGKKLESIPPYLKIDYSCGDKKDKNCGPLNLDAIRLVCRTHESAEYYFNMYDIIEEIGALYYLEDSKVHQLKEIKKDYLHQWIADKLSIAKKQITILGGRS